MLILKASLYSIILILMTVHSKNIYNSNTGLNNRKKSIIKDIKFKNIEIIKLDSVLLLSLITTPKLDSILEILIPYSNNNIKIIKKI